MTTRADDETRVQIKEHMVPSCEPEHRGGQDRRLAPGGTTGVQLVSTNYA